MTIGIITVDGWAGRTRTAVEVLGLTKSGKKYRIRAIVRTKLGGRDRWLEPGQETTINRSVVTDIREAKP